MKVLIVEDDFVSRNLLLELFSPFSKCDLAVNGKEAMEAFKKSIEEKDYYDLITLDIMMPEMDGEETLEHIRNLEEEAGIYGLSRCKIIMTTALDDPSTIMKSFRNQTDAYIVKPIDAKNLMHQLQYLGLVA
ncbi:MAG: PleD family two-component system response regulator [Candidatus Zixiibacteriota bacterium]